MASCCIRALEGSNYDVRVCVAELLGSLLASSQKPEATKVKKIALEEIFGIMSAAFLRGGVGFLKGGSGELLKSGTSQDVRVGVTQVGCKLNLSPRNCSFDTYQHIGNDTHITR